jgi:hypothetical protein
VFCSCSSLEAGIYLSSVDNLNGEDILKNETKVKMMLQEILLRPEYYDLKAYERTGISFQVKRTDLLIHSFYVITDVADEYHTLSFYGTKIAFYSEGAWILDGDSDMTAYDMFLNDNNQWDVIEIKKDIDFSETIRNILRKIESNITYYYKDHINNRPNMDNCNTALYESLVEKKRPFRPPQESLTVSDHGRSSDFVMVQEEVPERP